MGEERGEIYEEGKRRGRWKRRRDELDERLEESRSLKGCQFGIPNAFFLNFSIREIVLVMMRFFGFFGTRKYIEGKFIFCRL